MVRRIPFLHSPSPFSLTPPHFSPIFCTTQACAFARPLFRSLVRSPPAKRKETAATQAITTRKDLHLQASLTGQKQTDGTPWEHRARKGLCDTQFVLFFQSGESSHQTHYTYVDNTERDKREAEEKEKRRLENERRQREAEARSRIEREREEEEARRREQYKQQRQREMEEEEAKEQKRLQLEAELCRRRDELFNYTFGNKTRLDNFLGLQIEDVTQLRIGVFGPTGSGKSCFINTCERTVRQTEKGTAPDSTTGQEGTITLQDYLSEMFFRLVDTRGFFKYDANETAEFENILTGKIQPGDNIVRPDKDGQASAAQEIYQKPEFWQRMHGIIIVVKANDPRLREGALGDYLKPVRDMLRKSGNVF